MVDGAAEALRYLALPGAETRVALWLIDETGPQPVDLWDLHMHAWAARRVMQVRPDSVVDIGSDALFCAILSQFVPVTTIDIRQWSCGLPRLTVRQGNILALPYDTGSVECLSCLSVVEHVGLGRYGDALDPLGSVKALTELGRVVAAGGHLLLALPIGHTPGVVFNAHRIHRREDVLAYLPGFRIAEEVALYPQFGPVEDVAALGEWQFAMWCAHLTKEGE